VGAAVGTAVGAAVGSAVGAAVGDAVGAAVDSAVGIAVGATVGVAVGPARAGVTAIMETLNTETRSTNKNFCRDIDRSFLPAQINLLN
jgi:outer membrane lipoprotein SlyB